MIGFGVDEGVPDDELVLADALIFFPTIGDDLPLLNHLQFQLLEGLDVEIDAGKSPIHVFKGFE